MRKFIDINYYKNTYKAPRVNELEENPVFFDYLAQQASTAVYNQIVLSFEILDQIANIRVKLAIQHATAAMVEYYHDNGTNFSNTDRSDSTDGVSNSFSWKGDFNPSILPDYVASILANEGIYLTVFSDALEIENEDAVLDQDVISTSVRENLINQTQLEINEFLDQEVIDNTGDITENTLTLTTKVDNTIYETEQATQDVLIATADSKADVNRALIEELIAGQQAGGTAFLAYETPFDETDATVGRVEATFLPQNANPPVLINPTRPAVLGNTQQTGFKTIDVGSNGVLQVDFNATVERAATTGPVSLKIELVDLNGNVVVKSTTKKFDLTAQVELEDQTASLQYEVVDITEFNPTRSFYIRFSTTVDGDTVYINGGANTSVALVLSGGTDIPSTTDDVKNMSTVVGTTATDAFNTLDARVLTNTNDILATNQRLDEIYLQIEVD